MFKVAISTAAFAPIVWVTGRRLGLKGEVTSFNALWVILVVFAGGILVAVDGDIAGGFVSALIVVIFWLLMFKRFFDVELMKALALSVVLVAALWLVLAGIAMLPKVLYPPPIE